MILLIYLEKTIILKIKDPKKITYLRNPSQATAKKAADLNLNPNLKLYKPYF